jgi:predicted GNAT superfamily acetyltransferase
VDAERRGVGRALKWHQRAWSLRRGITRVRWTFDPLVRRNAVLNLQVLGARANAYQQDVYGRMQDARNAGVPTDRLVVDWDLGAARVEVAAAGRTAEPDLAALRRAGAQAALTVADDGSPHLAATDAPRRLVQVPADIERLRHEDPDTAATWGAAIRVALGEAIDHGFRITGFTRDGWYVLGRDRGVQELSHADPSA